VENYAEKNTRKLGKEEAKISPKTMSLAFVTSYLQDAVLDPVPTFRDF